MLEPAEGSVKTSWQTLAQHSFESHSDQFFHFSVDAFRLLRILKQ